MARRWVAGVVVVLALALTGCSSGSSGSDTVTDRATVESFVQEARAYAEANGKEAALEAFNDPNGPFHRGELYIYAYDFNGNALAHGGNPELVGQNLASMKDANGVDVITGLSAAARNGGGWFEYVWPNPAAGNASQTKWGYAMQVDETWWLGSGTYAK